MNADEFFAIMLNYDDDPPFETFPHWQLLAPDGRLVDKPEVLGFIDMFNRLRSHGWKQVNRPIIHSGCGGRMFYDKKYFLRRCCACNGVD